MLENIESITLQQLEEIKEQAVSIKRQVLSSNLDILSYVNNNRRSYYLDILKIVSISRKIYATLYYNEQKKRGIVEYKRSLPSYLKNIFELYVFFPEDEDFMKYYVSFKRNASKMANQMNLPEYVIKNRYKLYIQTNRKKLEEENKQNEIEKKLGKH